MLLALVFLIFVVSVLPPCGLCNVYIWSLWQLIHVISYIDENRGLLLDIGCATFPRVVLADEI